MCMLLKLHYAKFDVSSLFCSKVIEEKPLRGLAGNPPPPPLVKEGLCNSQFQLLTSPQADLWGIFWGDEIPTSEQKRLQKPGPPGKNSRAKKLWSPTPVAEQDWRN